MVKQMVKLWLQRSRKKNLVVDFDALYLALGENKSERQEAYEQYARDTIPEGEIKLIRDFLQRG